MVVLSCASVFPPLLFPPPAPSPKVNDWAESPESHGATSILLPETVKQVPSSFCGWKESGPDEPSKANIWESVTSPPFRHVSAERLYLKMLLQKVSLTTISSTTA